MCLPKLFHAVPPSHLPSLCPLPPSPPSAIAAHLSGPNTANPSSCLSQSTVVEETPPLSITLFDDAVTKSEANLDALLMEPLGVPDAAAGREGHTSKMLPIDGASSRSVPSAAPTTAAAESFAARVHAKLLRAGIQAPKSMVSAAVAVTVEVEVKRVQRTGVQLAALSIELQVLFERQRLRRERQRAVEGANARSVPIEACVAELASWQHKLEEAVVPEPLPASGRSETTHATCEAYLPSAACVKRGMGVLPRGQMPAPTPIVSRYGTVSNITTVMDGVIATLAPPIGVTPLISRCQSASVADCVAGNQDAANQSCMVADAIDDVDA